MRCKFLKAIQKLATTLPRIWSWLISCQLRQKSSSVRCLQNRVKNMRCESALQIGSAQEEELGRTLATKRLRDSCNSFHWMGKLYGGYKTYEHCIAGWSPPCQVLNENKTMVSPPNASNATVIPPSPTGARVNENDLRPDDATWILTSAFIIFTMQSGFGLLESGLVSRKNETNIMVKNAVDVVYGGLAYWLFGFGFSFGNNSNPFCGLSYFLTDVSVEDMGVFAKYFFQLSFATTATTIVSGAMAERVCLKAYILFSFVNTLSFCFPAHWVWADDGFLKRLGVVDIAGCGPVHLVGGVSGLVATLMLKPRHGRFDEKGEANCMPMASSTNVLLGTFMLWWGWLGFNCGSTFGISGGKWKLASR